MLSNYLVNFIDSSSHLLHNHVFLSVCWNMVYSYANAKLYGLDISYLSDFEFEISVLFVSKIIPLDLDLYSTVDVGDIGDIKINLLQLAINGKYKD